MKKMIGFLSLIAIVTLSFTAHATDAFDDVGIVKVHCKSDTLAADFEVALIATPINSNFDFAPHEAEVFLPIEVGLFQGALNIVSLIEFSATLLLPIEVGLQGKDLSYNLISPNFPNSLSQGYFVASRYSDVHEPVGWATNSKS